MSKMTVWTTFWERKRVERIEARDDRGSICFDKFVVEDSNTNDCNVYINNPNETPSAPSSDIETGWWMKKVMML
jgi:hypothetical protein